MATVKEICFTYSSWAFPLIAGLIGVTVALAELLNRYSDFKLIISSRASVIYMLINGLAAFGAYFLINEFKILQTKEWVRAVVAGTSAMLILRSSFANLKINNKIIDVGIASILQMFLNAANRSFDQKRSEIRLDSMAFMKKVDFKKAKFDLPETCFNLMKDVSNEEKNAIIDRIKKLDDIQQDQNKSLNLGVILSDATDVQLLKKAVDMMKDSIEIKADDSSDSDDDLNKLLDQLK